MTPWTYYYNCSPEYIYSINAQIHDQVLDSVGRLPKRQTQSMINADLFWELTSAGWFFDTVPSAAGTEFFSQFELGKVRQNNQRNFCLTSTTMETRWHSDFARSFDGRLVQIEAQFAKVEAMFKDFCGFRIAYAERRLALGIEIVLYDPLAYFSHRKSAISGMASFNIAKETLNTIGLDCPIWLIGVTG